MKKQTVNSYLILVVTVLGGLAGCVLRSAMLSGASWAYAALWGLSTLVFLALIPLCAQAGTDCAMERNLPRRSIIKGILPPAVCTGLGGVAFFVTFLVKLLEGGLDTLGLIAAVLGLFGGGCLLIQAYLRHSGKASASAAGIITIALVADLFCRFRHWSSDPLLEDYCFQLLAHVFSMLAAYYLMGFPMGKGKRRLCIFYSMIAAFFGLICLGDKDISTKLFYIGLVLWLAFGGCDLRPGETVSRQADKEDI